MTTPVLTEDTLKALEELLGRARPGGNKFINYNIALICILRNNAAELIRGYRLGIALDKDRKP